MLCRYFFHVILERIVRFQHLIYIVHSCILRFLPSSAQAQAQLEAELALFSFDPAPQPTTHPPPPVKVYLAAYMHPVATNAKVRLTGNTATLYKLA